MKNPDNSLLQLVHSLDSREKKRYSVRLKAGGNADSKQFALLYKGMAEEKDFDEKRTKQDLGLETGSAFSMLKRYLYEDILAEVVPPFSASNESGRIRRELNRADYFRSKGLLELAFRTLKKAYRKAVKYERFAMVLEIQDGLFKLVVELNKEDLFKWYEETVVAQQQKALAAVNHLQVVNSTWLPLLRKIKSKGKIAPADINRFKSGLGMEQGSESPPFKEITLLARCCILLGAAFSVLGDRANSIRYRRKVHQLYRSHPHLIADRLAEYSGNLYNLANSLLVEKHTSEASKLLDGLRDVSRSRHLNRDLRMREISELRVRTLEINLALAGGELARAFDLAAATKHSFQACLTGIGREFVATIRMQEIFFGVDLRRADMLKRIRKLQKSLPKGFRTDFRDSLVLVEMVLLYQKREFDYLAYFCTNHERAFRKRYPGEVLFCRLPGLFKRLMQLADDREKRKVVREFVRTSRSVPENGTAPLRHVLGWVEQMG